MNFEFLNNNFHQGYYDFCYLLILNGVFAVGISRRVSSMFWTAPETQLGDANKIVSCNDVIFVVGTKGVQRIHGTAVRGTLYIYSEL